MFNNMDISFMPSYNDNHQAEKESYWRNRKNRKIQSREYLR